MEFPETLLPCALYQQETPNIVGQRVSFETIPEIAGKTDVTNATNTERQHDLHNVLRRWTSLARLFYVAARSPLAKCE